MVLTYSSMLPLGTQAPDFSLVDTISGKTISLHDCQSDIATVIMFICNHCPYVIHIQDELVKLTNEYQKKGVKFVAINANDAENYPPDAPDKMQQIAKEKQYSFPYLYDETQQVAKAYHAECTPEFYVFDQHLKCVYRGRFDDSSPGKDTPVTGKDLQAALNSLLDNKPINANQHPSMGCNIKWKVSKDHMSY